MGEEARIVKLIVVLDSGDPLEYRLKPSPKVTRKYVEKMFRTLCEMLQSACNIAGAGLVVAKKQRKLL